MNVEQLVRRVIAQTGMTQFELAERLQVSQPTVNRWLTKNSAPRSDTLERLKDLAAELGIEDGGRRPAAIRVPILSIVSAGRLRESEPVPMDGAPTIPVADLPPGDYFALRVQGDSMNRVSPDGSLIIVDHADREMIAGRFYVFSIRGEATYKMWRPYPVPRLSYYSWNETDDAIFFRPDEDMHVVGRVKRTMLDL